MTGEQGEGASGSGGTVDLGIPSIGPASEIGRGAAGVVYRAEQPAMNRTVAVKLLPFAALDEAARARFERECRAMGSVSGHAGIVTVYEAGFTPGGQPYILMELMDGGSLEQRLALRGPFQWEEVVEIGVRLVAALEVAHRKGILHRDIKPDNVLVSTYGDAKLADFSIARLAGATKTQTGLVAATPAHAPPEVLRGEEPSVRGDVYSLASTLWALLAGGPAFLRPNETTIFALLRRVEEDPVPDLRPRGIPDPICRVLERAMAKDPMQRPATANEFGAELLAARDQARAWRAAPPEAGGTYRMPTPPAPTGPGVAGHPTGQVVGPPPAYPTHPPGPTSGMVGAGGGAPVPLGPMTPPGMPPPGAASPVPGAGWPAPPPAAAPRRGPSRQQLLVGGGVVAGAAVLAVVLILLFGRGSSSPASSSSGRSASASSSTSGGAALQLDPCVVGAWVSSAVSGTVAVGGVSMDLSGGDGERLVINGDGTFTDDYASASPIQGDGPDGVTVQLTTKGKATGHATTSGGRYTATYDNPDAITQTVGSGGVVAGSGHPNATVQGTYSCSNGAFNIRATDGTATTFGPG